MMNLRMNIWVEKQKNVKIKNPDYTLNSSRLDYFVLTEDHALMGGIMLFASGGILYLVFEDVAPQAKLEKHWMPALGAIFGFVLGLAGHLAVT